MGHPRGIQGALFSQHMIAIETVVSKMTTAQTASSGGVPIKPTFIHFLFQCLDMFSSSYCSIQAYLKSGVSNFGSPPSYNGCHHWEYPKPPEGC